MANITTNLLGNSIIKVVFSGRQGRHLRLTGLWTDWMLEMNDFRDLVSPLSSEDVDSLIEKLLNSKNKLPFIRRNGRQEYKLGKDKKIVRRLGPGKWRKEYQSVALFIKNKKKKWPPNPIVISKDEILILMRAMITLDRPDNYYIRDSLRNYQYLLAMLWVKKRNPDLLQGKKRPNANEIFRISLVK